MSVAILYLVLFFFFNDTATTEIYTLSLHDALPIYKGLPRSRGRLPVRADDLDLVAVLQLRQERRHAAVDLGADSRSEEHTSELQSRQYLVCRLLLEKKK